MDEFKVADMLYVFATGTLIPIVVLWLQRLAWPGIYKFGLAVALSIVAGGLKAYSEGQLGTGDILNDVLAIFTVSQLVYQASFKTLNLHAFLYPEAVVLNQAKTGLATSLVEVLNRELAYKLLDEESPEQLDVTVELYDPEG